MKRPIVKVGDVLKSHAQTLVNTVNCVGIMGKGIALEFKKRFPEMFEDYQRRCEEGRVRLGEPYLFRPMFGPWILNFPTKDHWRSVSRLTDIVAGLEYLSAHYEEWGIASIAVPPLGCGNGQLEWNVVGPTLYRHLSQLNIPVEMYAPFGTPEVQLSADFLGRTAQRTSVAGQYKPQRIGPGAVALIAILDRISRERYHVPLGRTAFQKMAYFATEAGIPTGLTYQRGSYGPFEPNLKKLVAALANNGLLVETKRGQMFEVRPGPSYEDSEEHYKQTLSELASKVEEVADLFLRIARTSDAEIAATVHFAARRLEKESSDGPPITEANVLTEIAKWKAKRRPKLDDGDIARWIRNLNLLGWIHLTPSEKVSDLAEASH